MSKLEVLKSKIAKYEEKGEGDFIEILEGFHETLPDLLGMLAFSMPLFASDMEKFNHHATQLQLYVELGEKIQDIHKNKNYHVLSIPEAYAIGYAIDAVKETLKNHKHLYDIVSVL